MATRSSKGAPPNGKLPVGDVTPEEAAKIRAQAAGKEQAPGTRQQAALFQNWREAADRLGSPFETEKIPISKLRAMRRDPMLAFGLNFIKVPHVRAKWFINARSKAGPNAALAAHLDYDLRRIYSTFVLQFLNSLDYGFQPIVKRYEVHTPAAYYIETDPESGEQQELPAWSEGSVQPIAFKPFVSLPVEGTEPIWKGDDFDGISYIAPENLRPEGEGAQEVKVDLAHALWVTNEREQSNGSLWGYPRLGYAYRYWWSYWFRWSIADRAFERKADPSVKVYYPEGQFETEDGITTDYGEYALSIGERMRSGGVIALPSETYEDINGRGQMRMWDIDFTKDAVNFEPFDKSFDYLDVQKLRSLSIPEQAFLEGKGGTSSRNVAAELGQSFVESQAVLSRQIEDTINRWIIPQWVAVNYPEFLADGGSAAIQIQGFADQDIAFQTQVLQLIGQDPTGAQELLKLVDVKKMLEDAGTPIASFTEQTATANKIAQQATLQGPPAVPPSAGGGVATQPALTTGFNAYYNPPEMVQFATNSKFLENLPDSPHYNDKAVRAYATQLHNIWRDVYRDELANAVEVIKNSGEVQEEDDVAAALPDFINRAQHLIRGWKQTEKWPQALNRTRDLYDKIADRAARLELKRVGKRGALTAEERQAWIDSHISEFATKVADTTRAEVRDFIAKRMEEGEIDPDVLAQEVQEHFQEFPEWKAARLARTETRDVYNAATLLAAADAAIERVQAVDAQHGSTDSDCEKRDGKIFDLDSAWQEYEHPNGTLAWRMVPAEFSVNYEDLEAGAEYDGDSMTITLANDLGDIESNRILKSVLDRVLT